MYDSLGGVSAVLFAMLLPGEQQQPPTDTPPPGLPQWVSPLPPPQTPCWASTPVWCMLCCSRNLSIGTCFHLFVVPEACV